MKGKKRKKLLLLISLILLLSVSFVSVSQAKTTEAKSTSIKDVRKAKTYEGSWEKLSNGVKYKLSDGSYVKSKWIKVDNVVYYINSSGYRTTGWVHYRKNYYYMGKGGKLFTGWLDQKRFLRNNGTRASGKVTIKGQTYYFSPETGKWQGGWKKVKKKYYYFSKKTGVMRKNSFVTKGGAVRFVGENGAMVTDGWLVYNGKNYYLDSDGIRVTGEQYIDEKWCYFDENGVYDPEKKITTTIDPNRKMVALTFDDGPGQYTGTLLNCLKSNGARATFFMVGSNAVRYKSVIKQMSLQGCELGNHSYSHPYLENLSDSGIRSEISRTSEAIKNACGNSPTLVRLPYGGGHNNSRVLSAVGLPSIYWSLDTRDWANTGNPQHTINEVLNNVHDGDIVLMHDIHYSSVQAALTIIPELKKRGYQMVTVTELAKYKGKQSLKSGRTYYNFR